MRVLKGIALITSCLCAFSLAACTPSKNEKDINLVVPDEKPGWVEGEWPLYETSEETATYIHKGNAYQLGGLVCDGVSYVGLPARFSLCGYRFAGEFDTKVGYNKSYRYIYTMAADSEKNFILSEHHKGYNDEDANFNKDSLWYYVKEGFQMPDPFAVTLTKGVVSRDNYVGNDVEEETLEAWAFEEGLRLDAMLSQEETVTEIDKALGVYLTFDLSEYPYLQLGELALYDKDGEWYARIDPWEETYYKLTEEYQTKCQALFIIE